jgi:EpsI family protein
VPDNNWRSQAHLLRRTPVVAVTAILVLEIILFYMVPTREYLPDAPPLKEFQTSLGPWKMARETEIETEVQELLKADVTLNREYLGPTGIVSLFVGFFRTQRAGVTPHSPKVCLPGAGWTQESSQIISVPVPEEAAPIPVNRYIVSHGEERGLVLYWYQGAHRVVANEYLSKLYLMLDSLRYRRSDVAIVRVIVPLNDAQTAEQGAVQFIQMAYAPLKHQIGF